MVQLDEFTLYVAYQYEYTLYQGRSECSCESLYPKIRILDPNYLLLLLLLKDNPALGEVGVGAPLRPNVSKN